MVLRYLVEKEFRQISRNPLFLILTVWFPIIALLILPWAVTFEVNDVRVCVVNQCGGTFADRLMRKLDASPLLVIAGQSATYTEALKGVDAHLWDVVMVIPNDFSMRLGRGETSTIRCAISAVDGSKALLVQQGITRITHQYARELARESGREISGFDLRPQFRYNPELDYKVFMLPALVVVMMTLVCGLLAALNVVQEKELGTIYQINVTPVGRYEFILSKVIPYWIMGLIIFSIGYGILGGVYNLWPLGSVALLYLCTGVYILTISAVGIIVSNYSRTLQQAMLLILFYILILFLISGLFTAVETMPGWAHGIAYLNPLTYYVELLRAIYLRGAGLVDVSRPLLRLCGFAVLTNLWAVLSYRKIS